MTTKTAKPEGMYPQADPTAPGGMSKANLRLELAEKHGVSMNESREMSWPDLIQAVADGRLLHEVKQAKGSLYVPDVMLPPGKEQGMSPEEMFDDQYEYDRLESQPDLDDMFPSDGDVVGRGTGADFTIGTFDGETGKAVFPSDEDEEEDDFSDLDNLEDDFSDLDNLEEYDDSDEAIMGRNIREITAHAQDTVIVEMDSTLFDPETLFEEIVQAQAEQAATLPPPIFLPIPGIKDYVFDGHAGAGPSASERWMNCTMSLSASRAFLEALSPNQQRQFAGANLAARQGTTAHAVGEAKANHMLGRIDDAELQVHLLELSVEPDEIAEAYDDEMEEYVNEYVDLIKSYADERGPDKILIEARVEAAIPLTDLHEGEVYIVRGAADAIGLPTEDDPVLVVADLKYGNGLWVDVDENSQARIYALGVLGLLVDEEGNLTVDIERVRLHIAQPRLGGIRTWEESLDDLLDWRDDVLAPALTKALYGANEGATYEPSASACQFCPARGGCPALTEQRVAEAAELFDVVVESEFNDGPGAFPETTTLDNARLAALLAQITGLIDIHKDLKEEAQRRLHRGEQVPGYHLVNYSPPRKWKPEAQDKIAAGEVKLTKAQREALFKEPVLITPKQAVLALGERASAIEGLYDTPEKRPVVAPETDRRSAWTGRPPEAMFDDESTDEDRVHAAEEMFPDE